MENLSHSFRRNQSAPTTFSRKFYNGNSFAAKTVYDDVFGGPPKFGVPTFSPRVEDYCEIFGSFNASRAASIPVLDLPVVDEAEVSFDVRSSSFDYSDIFGGLSGLDFAVSYEELLQPPVEGNDSSDEAWTPTESEYLSEESVPSSYAATDQFFSNGDSYKSFDDEMQFSDSFPETNQRNSKDVSTRLTNVTHICSASETAFVDENSSFSQMTEVSRPNLKARDDITVSNSDGNKLSGGKHCRKTKSLPRKDNAALQTFEIDNGFQRRYCSNVVCPDNSFVTVTDISLRTNPSEVAPPPRPPPMFTTIFETPGNNSPPFFDVEVDASSSASTVEDVVDKVQAKLRIAREIIDRKKSGFTNSVNLVSKTPVKDIEGKRNDAKIFSDERGQEECAEGDNDITIIVKQQEQLVTGTSGSVRKYGKEFKRFYTPEDSGEWKEATEFYELRTDIPRKAFVQVKTDNALVKEVKAHTQGQEAETGIGALLQIEENDKRETTVDLLETCKKDVKVVKKDNERKGSEEEIDIAWNYDTYDEELMEVDKWEEAENLAVMREVETDDALMFKGDNAKQGYGTIVFEHDNQINEACEDKDIGRRPQVGWKWEGHEKRLDEGFKKPEDVKRSLEVFQEKDTMITLETVTRGREETKQKFHKSSEFEHNYKKEVSQNEFRKGLQKAFRQELNGVDVKKDVIKEKEKKKVDASVEEVTRKGHRESCEVDFPEKRMQVARGREEEEGLDMAEEWDVIENKSREVSDTGRTEERSKQPETSGESESRPKDGEACIELKPPCNSHAEFHWNEFQKKLKSPHDNSLLVDKDLLYERYSGRMGTSQIAHEHEEKGKVRSQSSGKQQGADNMAKASSAEALSTTHAAQVHQENGVNHIIRENNNKRVSSKSFGSGQKEKKASAVASDSEFLKSNSLDHDGRGGNFSRVQLMDDQKLSNNKSMSAHQIKEHVEAGKKVEAFQSTVTQGRGYSDKIAPQVRTNETTNPREKRETFPVEEKDIELMKKERELEKDRLRKLEEERERKREREKDRMAVDIATTEARERAFSEARERAEKASVERANAEARQRALTEARERLEKACLEVREKSAAEKASIETRSKVEHAEVDRGKVENRERAVEKQMTERAPFDSRGRVERSLSEKQPASSREDRITRTSSLSDRKSMGHPTASRPPYSAYSAVEGESAQRHRARLERHQRTAERAANALAEKNKRDLHVQREQAERNRLAETLDAEVKRWSSGKEGNLRALLSTLQYILGTGSGWQPIPLTDVITTAAVKKAYRKATLCVHPDKLQQRGATIQHKYICEKVFDLLKEAWNRFNSEER